MEAKVLYIVLLVASVISLGNAECAPPDEIYPCRCERNTSLVCGNLNEEELTAIFEAQKSHHGGEKLDIVEFSDYRLTYVPSGLLSGIDFYFFIMNTSALMSFNDPHTGKSSFVGVENQVYNMLFTYNGNSIDDFDWSSLSPLKGLVNFGIQGAFSAIRTPLPSLPKVELFNIEDSNISFIADNAFAGLTGVQEINFINNKIKSLSRNMFPNPASELIHLITTEADVTEVPEDYCESMPVLKILRLPPGVKTIPKFKSTNVVSVSSGGGLTCDCKLKWLLELRREMKVNIFGNSCRQPEGLRGRELTDLSVEDIC